ncbi:hypothetical protein F5Y18DRAFT_124638 [Xylariaceae sp. FL1019]|nr:hypothetical protein F5Y18DRAFT_124638 [Xylariaceae sp. FL1019]
MASSVETLPAELSPPLSPREAIADALYRCFAGLDTPDLSLWESSCTQDAECIIDGRKIIGMQAINAEVYEPTSRLDTTHFVTNLRIHIEENGTEARLAASTLAQRYRSGTGREAGSTRLLAGGPYFVHLVKDAEGGLWRIKTFEMSPRWTEGDIAVLAG